MDLEKLFHSMSVLQVTKPRHGSMYKWPLSQIIPWQKQREVYQRLSSLGWTKKTFEEVSNKSRLLFSSAEMFNKPLWQTVWTQIRLLL